MFKVGDKVLANNKAEKWLDNVYIKYIENHRPVPQNYNSIYGIVTSIIVDDDIITVDWIDINLNIIHNNSYYTKELILYSRYSMEDIENNLDKLKQKLTENA